MIEKNNLMSRKARIGYLQIFILILSAFAFSYIIYQSIEPLEESIEEENDLGDISLLNFLTDIITSWVNRGGLNLASAEELTHCCPQTKTGALCQNVPSDYEDCDESLKSGDCDYYEECWMGCCMDSRQGTCSPMTPKGECNEDEGGNWEPDENCNIEECQRGCCILGSSTQFVTGRRCEILTDFRGLDEDRVEFKQNIDNEMECSREADRQDRGACIIGTDDMWEGRGCEMSTERECIDMTGDANNFYGGQLCTNPDLDTDCEPTDRSTCHEGKIYFMDSCDNMANIYDGSISIDESDKYWQEMKSGEDICGHDSANIEDPECGNCDRYKGSFCGDAEVPGEGLGEGDKICRNLNCEDAPWVVDAEGDVLENKTRYHGDHWCVYDSKLGEGKDTVGSRHFKYYCLEGEVGIEPCADYRQEVCVGHREEIDGDNRSSAQCMVNDWRNCLAYNDPDEYDEDEKEDFCERNEYCYMFDVDVDDYFHFDVCMPKYPSGLDKTTEDGEEKAEELCGIASQTCTMIFQRKLSVRLDRFTTKWECIKNCDCEDGDFTRQMNDFCKSLGDCGGYYNIVGEDDDAYYVSGRGSDGVNLEEDYQNYTTPVKGEKIKVGDIIENFTDFRVVLMEGLEPGHERYKDGAYRFRPWNVNRWERPIFLVAFVPYIGGALLGLYVVGMIIWELLEWGLGIGETRERDVRFRCYPWQAPAHGDDCHLCNDDLKPCSQYRCESLGQACEFINEGTDDEKCIAHDNDHTPATISPLHEVSGILDYTEISNGFEIRDDGECIQEYETIPVGIETSNLTQCKYGVGENASVASYGKLKNMSGYFGGNSYLEEHSENITMPPLEELGVYGYDPDRTGDYNLYIKCQDYWGNKNPANYNINICVRPEPDDTSPEIRRIRPEEDSYLEYGETQQLTELWVNKPAECKWDSYDVSYNDMENNMTCHWNFTDRESYGWRCHDNFDVENQSIFYFRCKDQPWLDHEEEYEDDYESTRNVMPQSKEYNLRITQNPLNITKIEPDEGEVFVFGGTDYIDIDIEADTEGGLYGGEANCRFSINEGSWMYARRHDEYSTSNSITVPLEEGIHDVRVKCLDAGGNTAEGSTNFKLDKDTESPEVLRAYRWRDYLEIITSKPAECRYSFETCNFKWDSGNEMRQSREEAKHTADWEEGEKYYIKCRDEWGNEPDECSIIIEAM